jgi:hypothetical protein
MNPVVVAAARHVHHQDLRHGLTTAACHPCPLSGLKQTQLNRPITPMKRAAFAVEAA